MISGTRIKKKIDLNNFLDKVKNYSGDKIECTPHTFFRYSEEQRKTFNCEFVKGFVLNQSPVLVGQQFNGNYAVFYDYKGEGFLKVIITFISGKILVITFYTIEKQQLPKM